MEKMKQSQPALRKRKMMLALPLLVIPFMTLAFWALGGGKASTGKQTTTDNKMGLNLHLPDPKLKKETILDKLGFYDKADKDSLKLKQEMRNDPYYQQQLQEQAPSSNELEKIVQNSAVKFNQPAVTEESKLNTSPYNNSSSQAEEKLMQKLNELNKAINEKPEEVDRESSGVRSKSSNANRKEITDDDNFKTMLPSLNQSNDDDPELDKLSGMMDKIIAIQHPEKIKEELKQKSSQQKTTIFSVRNTSVDDTSINGFYSLDASMETITSNAIEAAVNEDQVLVSGSIIKLRLISDAYISDVKIPAGNFVFGTVSLDGERLNVAINSIRSGNSVYPVKMEAYDMDGLSGIYIPGAINRDVAKQSADNSLQTMQLTTLDPSLAAQATAAGIGTVKNLLRKKVKLIKVMVKAGYKVLLKDKG